MNNIVLFMNKLISGKNYTQENINKSMEFISKELSENNVDHKVLLNKGYKMIMAEAGEGDKTLVINGHIDVVYGDEEQFTPIIDDDKLYGRGSYDMLGAVAVMVDIMKELILNPPNIKVILMLVPTEETVAEIGTEFLLDNGVTGDFAICGEPTNLKIANIAKGVLQLRMTVYGKSAHGSRPWLGQNAITKALDIYNKIRTLPFAKEAHPNFTDISINLGMIKGGKTINKVPDIADMYIDIRYLPGQNAQDILDQIIGIDSSTKIEVLSQLAPVNTPSDNYYIELLKDVMNKKNIEISMLAQDGTSDACFFQDHKIPSIEFGLIGANHHGSEEYIELSSINKYKDILMNFIKNIEKNKCEYKKI